MGGGQSRILPAHLERSPQFKYFPQRQFSDDFYPPHSSVGTGINGSVCCTRSKHTKVEYTVKTVNKRKNPDNLSFAINEIKCLLNIDYPYIPSLLAVYENDKEITLVLEYINGVDIQQYMEQMGVFSESTVAKIAHQMLLCINYLHRIGIVHRDIKLENWILSFQDLERSKPIIKLIDFGLACYWDETAPLLTEICGSLSYLSPQLLCGQYDSQTDIWSVGICLYRMLCGVPPFFGTEAQIVNRIKKGNISFSGGRWKTVSAKGKAFISALLTMNSESRMTADEALSEAWLIDRHSESFMYCSGQMGSYKAKVTIQPAIRDVQHILSREKPSMITKARRKSTPGRYITSSDDDYTFEKNRENKITSPLALNRATTFTCINTTNDQKICRGMSAILTPHASRAAIWESFRIFPSFSEARKLFLHAVATVVTSAHIPDFTSLFMWMDRDNIGTLSFYDFDEILRSQFPFTRKETKELFDALTSIHPQRRCHDNQEIRLSFSNFITPLIPQRLRMLRECVIITFRKIVAFSAIGENIDQESLNHVFGCQSEEFQRDIKLISQLRCTKPSEKSQDIHQHEEENSIITYSDFASILEVGICPRIA